MTTDNALIKLEGLGKVFYTDEVETHALSDIHLEIKKGEYVAISGPSGCGKSTLLSILGLLDSPTGGTYRLNANSVQDLGAAQRARSQRRVESRAQRRVRVERRDGASGDREGDREERSAHRLQRPPHCAERTLTRVRGD